MEGNKETGRNPSNIVCMSKCFIRDYYNTIHKVIKKKMVLWQKKEDKKRAKRNKTNVNKEKRKCKYSISEKGKWRNLKV